MNHEQCMLTLIPWQTGRCSSPLKTISTKRGYELLIVHFELKMFQSTKHLVIQYKLLTFDTCKNVLHCCFFFIQNGCLGGKILILHSQEKCFQTLDATEKIYSNEQEFSLASSYQHLPYACPTSVCTCSMPTCIYNMLLCMHNIQAQHPLHQHGGTTCHALACLCSRPAFIQNV